MANLTSALPLEPLHGSVDPSLSQAALSQGVDRPLWAGPILGDSAMGSWHTLGQSPRSHVPSLVTLKLLHTQALHTLWVGVLDGICLYNVLPCDSIHPVLLQCKE